VADKNPIAVGDEIVVPMRVTQTHRDGEVTATARCVAWPVLLRPGEYERAARSEDQPDIENPMLLRGAIAAQDERERQAGIKAGVLRELHGCDWPDAIADVVLDLRAELAPRRALPDREALAEAANELRRFAGRAFQTRGERERILTIADAILAAPRPDSGPQKVRSARLPDLNAVCEAEESEASAWVDQMLKRGAPLGRVLDTVIRWAWTNKKPVRDE
jgi:hypothetical protein